MAGFYNCLKTNKSRNCIAMSTSEEEPEALEGEEVADTFAGRKKSKFQSFKDFFAKKKKSKDLPSSTEETKRKPSQANSDGGSPQLESILLPSPLENESNSSVGDQALMHDSQFPSEALCDVVGETSLQENFPEKVKKFEQSLCIESPLVMTTGKRMDGVVIVSEDGRLPRSLLEISTVHDILVSSTTQTSDPLQLCSSLSLDETDGKANQVASGSPPKHRSNSLPLGCPASPHGQALLVDFNTPASPLGCLDTSAAKHRIAMNPRKQKGAVKKSRHFLVEQMLEEQEPLEPEEEERRPSKLLEEAAGQREVWEGLVSHHVVKGNEDGTDDASSGTRTSEALPSSSTGLQEDEMCVLISDAQNLPETQLQSSSTVPCPDVPASFIKGRETEKKDHEEKKGTCPPTDDQKAQSGPEVTENSKSFHLKTKATGLHNTPLSALPKSKVGKEPIAEDIQIACSQRTDVRANVSKPARNRHRACDRSVCGDSSTSLKADPMLYVPQLSSSALKASSDAPKDFMHKHKHTVNEDGRGPSDMELQPSQGPGKPIDSLQGTLSTLEVDPDRPVLLNVADKKPCLQPEDSTVRELGSLSSGRPSTVGSTEVASKTCPPVSTPGVPLGNVITTEESKATEMNKTQAKSSSAKPVRFTIAPAWQRSLSGGSSSVDNSCPRNSPTSPVKPELFERLSPLDAGSQIINPPERPDRANRNTGVHLNSSPEEVQNSQSPFGVKLRRTSSLLKYQTEHHWDPPKLVPLAVSSPSSIKIEAKAPGSGASLQNRTDGTKGLLANSGKQDKNLLGTKPGEGGTELQASKPSEQTPPVFSASPSVQPSWISLAKQKQQGFQDDAVAKGQKKREEAVAKTGKEGTTPTSASRLQKQVSLTSDGSPKKSIPYQNVCLLENKVALKSAPLAAKGFARILPQAGPRMEKDTRLPPILPVASCSSTKPPWLSLAKKKAKAWSEMPQAVQ
ncbi:acrosomal protein KIAA1210 homolog isoform X2 [Crotalus tigris]|uniref:acrosomal protein KIAA1210 homolog isoform X2 n=1 Tax=Crotalus tigris TaxID=88082 RepID=UPI00192F4A98|nr:acrosomal protein KIAA1210 homolog isoform X2 [Crotalus tigris]